MLACYHPNPLLIIGILGAVSNIKRNVTSSTLSWDPPASLDLTNTYPDILYCLKVYNITCGVRDLFLEDCNVDRNYYTNFLDPIYIYEVVVTPRGNADGAENGTTLAIKGGVYS